MTLSSPESFAGSFVFMARGAWTDGLPDDVDYVAMSTGQALPGPLHSEDWVRADLAATAKLDGELAERYAPPIRITEASVADIFGHRQALLAVMLRDTVDAKLIFDEAALALRPRGFTPTVMLEAAEATRNLAARAVGDPMLELRILPSITDPDRCDWLPSVRTAQYTLYNAASVGGQALLVENGIDRRLPLDDPKIFDSYLRAHRQHTVGRAALTGVEAFDLAERYVAFWGTRQ